MAEHQPVPSAGHHFRGADIYRFARSVLSPESQVGLALPVMMARVACNRYGPANSAILRITALTPLAVPQPAFRKSDASRTVDPMAQTNWALIVAAIA